MNNDIEPKIGNFTLLVGPRPLNRTMLEMAASLSQDRPVRVLDGGNRFHFYTVSRLVAGSPQALGRITISRAFTCYQVLALLAATPSLPDPFIILDLLNTFYDENVRLAERRRILRQCLEHLHRLERTAPGAVSVHPPAVPSQAALELLRMLRAATPEVYFFQPPPPAQEQPRLF